MANRRGQNEGSIIRRSDGRWEAKISLGWEGGKPKRKSFYGKTRQSVQEQLNVALRAHAIGIPVAIKRQTVAEFLENWLEESVKPTTRPRTYESYSGLVRTHIIPVLGRVTLEKLQPSQVQSLLNAKLQGGLSPRTVQYIRAVLRRGLGQAVKWEQVSRNVAALVDPPKARRHEIQPLSVEDAKRFLEAVRGTRLEALFTVAVSVGLRLGEALGLTWSSVDFDSGVIKIARQLQRIKGKMHLTEPKTNRARRSIPLPKPCLESLRDHKLRQELQDKPFAGVQWNDLDLVFTSSTGTPLDERNVRRAMADILRRAGLPHMRFHDLRHTCASLLLVQGIHPRVVMEILGHSQISLTMDTYSHVMGESKREAANAMSELLTGS